MIKILNKMGITTSVTEAEESTPMTDAHTVSINVVLGEFNTVKITFPQETLSVIIQLTRRFERHKIFVDKISWIDELAIPGLEKFERKFATYILVTMRYNSDLTITPEIALLTANDLVKNVIGYACEVLPGDTSIRHMLDAYPLTLTADICNVSSFYSQLLGEAVKYLIKLRKTRPKFLPPELYNVIEGFMPLVGGEKALLTKTELDALYTYLGIRKSIYVHVWVNCLFELSKQIPLLTKEVLTLSDIIALCESSWLFLLLLSAESANSYSSSEEVGFDLVTDPIVFDYTSDNDMKMDLPNDSIVHLLWGIHF